MANTDFNIPFITNPATLAILETVIAVLGPGATPPYASNAQPVSIQDANFNPLVTLQLPGGLQINGQAGSTATSIGDAINSVMGIFSPFISAYGLILPILNVIRGIIEVICALLNPFALIQAVIRLFTKWLPPLLSLFPPLAGVLLVLNIIKIILAVLSFVILVVVPAIQLIIQNIINLQTAKGNIKKQAILTKVEVVIAELLNQLAILGIIKPILDTIMSILALVGGKPCDPNSADSTCCNTSVCPAILQSPPSGSGVLETTTPNTGITYKLITNNSEVANIFPYFINISGQSNGSISNPAPPPSDITDNSTLNVQLTTSRGLQIVVPILSFTDNNENLIISSTLGSQFVGTVSWEIQPDFNMLIFKNMVGVGCVPEVAAARDAINNSVPDLGVSVLDKFPSLQTLSSDYTNYNNGLNNLIGQLSNNTDTNSLQNIQNQIVANTNTYINNLQSIFSNVIANSADVNKTGENFTVTPNEVIADGYQSATISLIVTDATSAKLSMNVPGGINFPVVFTTTFGVIGPQSFNNSTGQITAQITSNAIGEAQIMAQVNGVYVQDFNTTTLTSSNSIRVVNFIGDTTLPARRFVSQSDNKFGNTPTKGPGK